MITNNVEYIPGLLNMEADFQSQSVMDSSKWKLNPYDLQGSRDSRYRSICIKNVT